MKNLGDFAIGNTVRGSFNSRTSSGTAITLAGSPALAVYKDDGTTEVTTGVSLVVDFDSITGYHTYSITTTDAFYSVGDYRVVISAGTVDGISVAGTEVAIFSIENRSVAKLQKNAFVATELSIATVTSQTVLVLTGGPTNDIANLLAIIYDASDAGARVVAEGSYVGSTGTLTFIDATEITITTSDKVTLVAVAASTAELTLADDAITDAKVAASAVTKIQAGLNTVAPDNAGITAIAAELAKVPRASSAISAGAFDMTITGGQDAEVTYSEPV